LRDVAARAGVSVATASRVFGGSERVNPETKARVLSAADELGYVVNGLARAMTGRGPRMIAFVTGAMIGPTFATLAAGVESVAATSGHLLSISTTQGSLEREQELINMFREQRVAAVLLVGSTGVGIRFARRAVEYGKALADVGAPLILCGRPPLDGHPELVSVDYDHRAGVAAAVDRLVALGHRRIAYAGQPLGMTTPTIRRDGYRKALRRNDIREDPQLIVECDNSEADSARAVGELLDAQIGASAVVGMTDNIAVGAFRAARARKLRIPTDLSVVGFDDVPIVGDLTPGLSTVHPPFFEVGVIAAEMALGLRPAGHVLLEPSFVERGSTAPPRVVTPR
jgi:LacI family transcriptional regulator